MSTTQVQHANAQTVDPVIVEIIRNGLFAVTEEMKTNFAKSKSREDGSIMQKVQCLLSLARHEFSVLLPLLQVFRVGLRIQAMAGLHLSIQCSHVQLIHVLIVRALRESWAEELKRFLDWLGALSVESLI